jgi:hypothetical protein
MMYLLATGKRVIRSLKYPLKPGSTYSLQVG